MEKSNSSLLLKTADAARLMGIAQRRLYALVAENMLPPGIAIRLGRSLRFSRPRLLAWLGTDEAGAGTEGEAADDRGR